MVNGQLGYEAASDNVGNMISTCRHINARNQQQIIVKRDKNAPFG